MQNKLFLKAADICELLEVKQTSAWLVDEEAAEVVRRIFSLTLE